MLRKYLDDGLIALSILFRVTKKGSPRGGPAMESPSLNSLIDLRRPPINELDQASGKELIARSGRRV